MSLDAVSRDPFFAPLARQSIRGSMSPPTLSRRPVRFRHTSMRTLAALCLCLCTLTAPASAGDKSQRKAAEAEARRLLNLGRAAEKQGRLLDARAQYLASEHVLFTTDAEKALEHVADQADQQVKALMASAASAYRAEQFDHAADLLQRAGALHPGNLAIGCNLAFTSYQQGAHGDALILLDECVDALRDTDTRRRLAELSAALTTGDRHSVGAADKARVVRVNDAILRHRDNDARQDPDAAAAATSSAVCAQLKPFGGSLSKNPVLLFDLAGCAESEGRLDEAARLLGEYSQAAPNAIDLDDVQARLGIVRGLLALPEPGGAQVRSLYTSAGRHVEARDFDKAIADYQQADEIAPTFIESKRRGATLLEAEGQFDRARTLWRAVALADTNAESRQQTERLVDGLDAEKGQYDEAVNLARHTLQDLLGRPVLQGEPVGRIYAASRLRLASEQLHVAAVLLPLAPEVNLLQAFIGAQLNDFRSVRASFDALRSQALPVSFYGAMFYKRVDPKKRDQAERTYGKFEFEKGTVRLAELSIVKPKKRTAQSIRGAGEDGLGRLGVAEGLRAGGFQGFTAPATAIKHVETDHGIIYLEVDDKRVKHRKMAIEPVSLVLDIPPDGPGARKYMNEYISAARVYGAVERTKLGKESTTAGEKLKIVYNIANLGLSVTSVMFGDFTSILDVAMNTRSLTHKIGLSQRQVSRLRMERQQVVQGLSFKAIPVEPVVLKFDPDLR